MKKYILIIVILGVLGALYGWFFVYNKPHVDYEKKKSEFYVSADELYNDYVNDQGSKYNGKVLTVTGIAQDVDDADSTITIVFVFNEGMFGDEGIRCSFIPKFNKQLRTYSFPAEIKLKGFCAGYNGTDVVLEHCSLIK